MLDKKLKGKLQKFIDLKKGLSVRSNQHVKDFFESLNAVRCPSCCSYVDDKHWTESYDVHDEELGLLTVTIVHNGHKSTMEICGGALEEPVKLKDNCKSSGSCGHCECDPESCHLTADIIASNNINDLYGQKMKSAQDFMDFKFKGLSSSENMKAKCKVISFIFNFLNPHFENFNQMEDVKKMYPKLDLETLQCLSRRLTAMMWRLTSPTSRAAAKSLREAHAIWEKATCPLGTIGYINATDVATLFIPNAALAFCQCLNDSINHHSFYITKTTVRMRSLAYWKRTVDIVLYIPWIGYEKPVGEDIKSVARQCFGYNDDASLHAMSISPRFNSYFRRWVHDMEIRRIDSVMEALDFFGEICNPKNWSNDDAITKASKARLSRRWFSTDQSKES